ncbi:MAG: dienelactone hydrolase family protein [Proteobacteria bacterium]|nr:dienelactone hydrolase family protein [Pseudomonadota bacterium]
MIDKRVTELYGRYTHKEISRRQFLEKLAVVVGGVVAAYAVLPLLENSVVQAELIAEGDVRLTTQVVKFAAGSGQMSGYQAQSKNIAKMPGILVVHENRGLNPHIEDVARRFALEGFLALAPDALSSMGGSPADPEQAIGMIKNLDMQETVKNFAAAAAYLKTHPQSTGKVGVVGFCWGGAIANYLAVQSADINAAVPYYGKQPPTEDVVKIKAALLLHYAGLDERINQGIPELKEALVKNGVEHELYMYEGAQHAFNNDTNATRYNKQAAELAWQRTIEFLKRKLKS